MSEFASSPSVQEQAITATTAEKFASFGMATILLAGQLAPITAPAERVAEQVPSYTYISAGLCSDNALRLEPRACAATIRQGRAAIVSFGVSASIAEATATSLEQRVTLASDGLANVTTTVVDATPAATRLAHKLQSRHSCVGDNEAFSHAIAQKTMSEKLRGFSAVVALTEQPFCKSGVSGIAVPETGGATISIDAGDYIYPRVNGGCDSCAYTEHEYFHLLRLSHDGVFLIRKDGVLIQAAMLESNKSNKFDQLIHRAEYVEYQDFAIMGHGDYYGDGRLPAFQLGGLKEPSVRAGQDISNVITPTLATNGIATIDAAAAMNGHRLIKAPLPVPVVKRSKEHNNEQQTFTDIIFSPLGERADTDKGGGPATIYGVDVSLATSGGMTALAGTFRPSSKHKGGSWTNIDIGDASYNITVDSGSLRVASTMVYN